MANYDLQYEGPAIDSILDTGKTLEDDGYIFLGLAAANTTSGTPDKRVFYFAGPGSYSGFGVTIPTGAVGIFAYNGSAWVTSVIKTGSIYDVSSANSGRTYASLSTAIEDIPSTARKAGMEIKFVNTSTSKYEVWIYQGTSTSAVDFTNTANWIGVDETPLSGSNNLVSSGGIYNAIQNAFDKLDMMDSTGTSVQSIQINVTLRRNDGTEEDPDWQTVASLVLPSATTTKAGLMSADDKAKITNTDGVFDISEYTASGGTLTQYASLSAALGTNGINVPQNIRKGGMSVKFVQSSDHKYVQYRLMATSFSTTPSDWQGVDAEPVDGSENLVESGGVAKKIFASSSVSENADLSFSDELGYTLVEFKKGHIKTKNFNSEDALTDVLTEEGSADLSFSDNSGYTLVAFKKGHLKTKNFDSEDIRLVENQIGIGLGFQDNNGLFSFILQENGDILTKNFNSRTLRHLISSFNYLKFKGKRLAIIGDSISTYANTIPSSYATYYPHGEVDDVKYMWWNIVCKNLGMNYTNTAWSGSWVTGEPKGLSAKPACSDQRIQDVGRNGTPDYIVCYIGINDFGQPSRDSLGNWQVTDSIIDDSEFSPTDKITEFRTAYSLMIDKLHKAYPRARVFCCTLPDTIYQYETTPGWPTNNGAGEALSQWNDSIREIAIAMGCTVIELASCGIHYYNQDIYMVDGKLHPNIAGQKLIGDYVTSQIIIKS